MAEASVPAPASGATRFSHYNFIDIVTTDILAAIRFS